MSFASVFKEKVMYFPPYVQEIIEKLIGLGHSAYAVGGCVRDALLGLIPHDYDVATSALPQEIRSAFDNTADTGEKYGTITVITSKKPVEVTTYRRDGEYTDGRRPQSVEFSDSITDDLARRDFTINAMAASVNSQIIDLYGGQADLKLGIIRCVGDPEKRFGEDALRIMRAFRFASQLSFDIEAVTLAAALDLSRSLSKISAERIFYELINTMMGQKPSSITPLINSGGLEFLGISHADGLYLLDGHANKLQRESAFAAFCFLCGVSPKEICLKLRSDKYLLEKSSAVFKALCFPPADIADKKRALTVLGEEYIYDAVYLCCLFGRFGASPKSAARQGCGSKAAKSGKDHSQSGLTSCTADKPKSGLKSDAFISCGAKIHSQSAGLPFDDYARHKQQIDYILKSGEAYKLSMLAVNGNDIAKISKSKEQIGKILNFLLDYVIEHPEKNQKECLLKAAKKYIDEVLLKGDGTDMLHA